VSNAVEGSLYFAFAVACFSHHPRSKAKEEGSKRMPHISILRCGHSCHAWTAF